MADTSANTNAEMAQTSLHPSVDSKANQDDESMRQFGAVLAQIRVDNIAALASFVRRKMQARDSTEQTDPSNATESTVFGCKVFPEPLRGSYNLAYCVLFDDGVEWILKVPANGSYARFDRQAADAMTSEALTMKMIKRSTTIPVPTVHRFDVSLNNEVGCPYILMDFLKGRPLYEGWFDPDASSAKREQFRARALQTLAAAIVQLNVFTLHRGGALRFDSAGQPVDVAGAKMPDAKAFYDCVDEGYCPEHDIWCENGPTADPSSYLLFTLNRRGHKKGDSAYSRGVHESTRLFTKWALELSDDMDHKGEPFVLAHPDLDLQNVLVEHDGTLSGILDWDGVAAVPLSVGCLRYPNWLIRDWDPVNYNWNVEAHEPRSYSGRLENTPDELVCYRAMYAQFIEMLLPMDPANSMTRKMGADVTRMSLITGSLEVAINRPEATGQMIGHIFRELKRIIGEEGSTDLSDTESLASNVGSNLGDIDESATETLVSKSEVEGNDSDESTEPTEIEEASWGLSSDAKGTNPEYLSQKCMASLHQPSPEDVDDGKDGTDLSARGVASRGTPGSEQDDSSDSFGMPLSDHIPAKEAARDQKAPASRKARVAKLALSLGKKGSQETAKALHKKEALESNSPRKLRVVKWALNLGEKGCKGASKAFYKKEASSPEPKNRAEAASPQVISQPDSNIAKTAISLCNRTEKLLRKITTRMHRDSAPGVEGSDPKETDTKWFQVFLKWLIARLKKIFQMPVKSGVESAETPTTAEEGLPQKIVLIDTEHCQRCNPGEEYLGWKRASDGDESAEIDSDNVWACIAAEIDKGGIPIDLIIQRRDVITQCVIENPGKEMEREKEEESYLKNKKAAGEAEKASEQTEVTNANYGSNLVETHMAGTEAALIEMPEGWVADVAVEEVDTTNKVVPASLAAVEGIVSEEVEKPQSVKPESEDTACPHSSVEAPSDPNSDAIDPDHTRPYNDDCGSSEPKSLISKLEAAKQRFDMEMALKLQNSGSASLIPGDAGLGIARIGDVKQQTLIHDAATSEPTEEANRKLRMVLSSFAKPRAANTKLESDKFQVTDNDGGATGQLGITNLGSLEPDTTSSAAIDKINQKLRTILLSLQKPEAVDTKLQPNAPQIAKDDNEDSKCDKGTQISSFTSVSAASSKNAAAVQVKAGIKAGRWFETPRGSLKRIEDEERVNDSSHHQQGTSKPSTCFPYGNEGLSETSVASREHKDVAKVSKFQLLFPKPSQSEAVDVFEVLDIDEKGKKNEEKSTRNNNGGEQDELEEGEVHDEETGLADVVRGTSKEQSVNSASAGGEDTGRPIRKTVDLGNFTMSEVCVAFGNGHLDDKRMKKLEAGFKMLLAEVLGKI